MDETKNPLVPFYFDVAWVVGPVLAVTLAIVALVSISRTAHRSRTEVVAWVLFVLVAPIIGSMAWLAVKTSLRRATPDA